jgi:hypothetical protein
MRWRSMNRNAGAWRAGSAVSTDTKQSSQQQPVGPTISSHGGLPARTACQFICKARRDNRGRRSLGERLERAFLPRKRKSGTFPAFTER